MRRPGHEQAIRAVLRIFDINVNFLVVGLVERLIIAVTQAEIQGEALRHLPLVFAEGRDGNEILVGPTSRERRDALLYFSLLVMLLLGLGWAVFRLTRPTPPVYTDPFGRWFDRVGDWTSVVCASLGILFAVLTRRRMKKRSIE